MPARIVELSDAVVAWLKAGSYQAGSFKALAEFPPERRLEAEPITECFVYPQTTGRPVVDRRTTDPATTCLLHVHLRNFLDGERQLETREALLLTDEIEARLMQGEQRHYAGFALKMLQSHTSPRPPYEVQKIERSNLFHVIIGCVFESY